MQIDITHFFTGGTPRHYFASASELGQFAGQITWGNAARDASTWQILADDAAREAFRAFVESSGGWSAEEIRAWGPDYLAALALQWVSGDIRESGLDTFQHPRAWADYEARAESGACHSRIFRDETGRVYWDISE